MQKNAVMSFVLQLKIEKTNLIFSINFLNTVASKILTVLNHSSIKFTFVMLSC